MVLKVLLFNFPKEDILKVPSNVTITQATTKTNPNLTLHDFHVIITDVAEILHEKWWRTTDGHRVTDLLTLNDLKNFKDRVKEQIETGGITFCFSSAEYFVKVYTRHRHIPNRMEDLTISYSFFLPIDLGVVDERGDTFYPKFEELKYFTPLLKQIPTTEIEWWCYFSKVPKNARVLGVNRAGYSVFMEVPLGAGKLIMLPRFKNRAQAVTTIVNEIIPQMIHEEEIIFMPRWLPDFSSPFEKQIRSTLSEIEKARRLLFTKSKALKKAVAFAFDKLGFSVDILPDGTLPDLRITEKERSAIVEVKGHENRQATRPDVLQILGYMSETDIQEKGVVVSNHEFSKKPSRRSKNAFSDGAIQLGEKNDISLVSSINLYKVVIEILEKKLNDVTTKQIRDKILTSSGLAQLSDV